jgi:hypothetical protein
MKFLVFLTLLSSSVFANRIVQPLYMPSDGEVFGQSTYTLFTSNYEQQNVDLSTVEDYELTSHRVRQDLQMGISKSLAVLFDITYTFNEELKYSTVTESSSGLGSASLGVRYKVNDAIDLPMKTDVALLFSPSLNNKSKAGANDEGTTNLGGQKLSAIVRMGSAKFYTKVNFDMFLEQTVEDASTNQELYKVDPYFDLTINPGLQINKFGQLVLDISALVILQGEEKRNYVSSGDQTFESTMDFGGNVTGFWQYSKELSFTGSLQYLFNPEQSLQANNNFNIRNRSDMTLSLGALYVF